MPSPDALTDRHFWDGAWSREARARRVSPRDAALGAHGFFLRAFPELRDCTAVELGGGGSYYLVALAKWRGVIATAVDYSATGLELTRQIFAINSCDVELVQADVFAWQPRQRFEAVLHFGLLEHFRDPAALLARSAALLAPHGRVIFTMPNMRAWGAKLWRRYAPDNWSHHVLHSDESVRLACERAGLRLQRSFHFGWPLIQIAPWETSNPILGALSVAQRATNVGAPLYSGGFPGISCYRAFVAMPSDDVRDS